jgi:YrhK-like protein
MSRERWMALLFAGGSTCFLFGPFPGYAALVGAYATAVTFFVGSILFTAGGATQTWLAYPERRSSRAAWWAAVVQLAGTLFFNISTFRAISTLPDDAGYDRLVWSPDAFGSICFLVASELAFAETCHRWVCLRARSRPWRIAALNLVGSIAFGVAAVASIVQPSDDEPVSAAICNAGTAFGAICFLAGGVLLIAEARSNDHRSQRSPDHDGPSARSAPADAVGRR